MKTLACKDMGESGCDFDVRTTEDASVEAETKEATEKMMEHAIAIHGMTRGQMDNSDYRAKVRKALKDW